MNEAMLYFALFVKCNIVSKGLYRLLHIKDHFIPHISHLYFNAFLLLRLSSATRCTDLLGNEI